MERAVARISNAITRISVFTLALGALAMIGGPDEARAEKRFFTIGAIEPKGGAQAEREPFPTAQPPAGGGYVLRAPDQAGRWEMSAYVWSPAQIIVNEGDEVTLEFVGVNGSSHPTEIKGLGKSFNLKRGEVTRVTFAADKAGVFPIECATHKPSMRGEIVVLPRR